MIYKSTAKNILLCEREDIWERKRDRDVLLPVFCQSFGISGTGAVQPQTLAERGLFRALCEASPYLFYWEDGKGKILGASRSLKAKEGIQNESEFIGKTEEELGCHFDADELNLNGRQTPHSVKNAGGNAVRVKELALTDGRIRKVSVVRVPWHLEKEIAGTLAMVDGDRQEIGEEENRLGLTDRETGLLSFRGAIEAGILFADHSRLRKQDFVGLLIDVPAFAEVMRDSAENAKEILTRISTVLRESLTPGWAISRIGLCCFLCFCRRESAGKIEEKLTAVSAVLPLLWRQLGIQSTPVLTHAAAYGSEVMSLDEMLQLLSRRLSSAEKEAYGDKPYTEDRVLIRRSLLDSLPERVVISDPKTYELVYMNQAARKDVGIGPDNSLESCLCYKVLEGFDAPCRDCPNLMLRMDRVLPASHMNHKTGENLIVRSFLTTWEKRTLKVTFAFNLNEYIDGPGSVLSGNTGKRGNIPRNAGG